MILLYNILKRRTEGVLPGLMCWIDYILKVSSCSVSGPPGLFCAILSRPSIWQVKVVLCRGVKHRTSHRQFVISPHCTTGQTIRLVCSWMSSVVDLWRVRVAEGLERVLPRCKSVSDSTWSFMNKPFFFLFSFLFFFFYGTQKWIHESVQDMKLLTVGEWIQKRDLEGSHDVLTTKKCDTDRVTEHLPLVRCVFPVRKLRD